MVVILRYLTRVIAGIQVPNTLILNVSIELAYKNLLAPTYNYVMRTRLNGQAIINKLPPVNRSLMDEEAFGVAAVLHDMAW